AAFPLPLVDLRGAGPALANEVQRRIAAAARQPFDLASGPLFRALLLHAETDEWVLVLVLHHIVSDGWSLGVLAAEIAARSGARPPLTEWRVRSAAYAVWQRQWLSAEVLGPQLAWWRARLAGAPPVLELPADRPRPAVRSLRGAVLPLHLGEELSTALR